MDGTSKISFSVQGALAGTIVGGAFIALGLLASVAAPGAGAGVREVGLALLGMACFGGVLPSIAPRVLDSLRALLKPLGVSEANLTIPLLGEVKAQLGNPQRAAARRIFFEMATRTVTQPLDGTTGSLRAALKSLYEFFEAVRGELKSMPPTPPQTDPKVLTLEAIGTRMLNDAVRPYLSRWHPHLDRWIADGHDEEDWPLAEACRADLDRMRVAANAYAYALAAAASVPAPERLLPEDQASLAPRLKDRWGSPSASGAALDEQQELGFESGLTRSGASLPRSQRAVVLATLADTEATVVEARESADPRASLVAFSRRLSSRVPQLASTPLDAGPLPALIAQARALSALMAETEEGELASRFDDWASEQVKGLEALL